MHERMHAFGFGVIVCLRMFFFWSLDFKRSMLAHIRCQCVCMCVCVCSQLWWDFVSVRAEAWIYKAARGAGQVACWMWAGECVLVCLCCIILDSLSCVCVCVYEHLLWPDILLATAESGLPPQLPAWATAVTQGQLSHGEGCRPETSDGAMEWQ